AAGLAGLPQLSQLRRLDFREGALDRPGLEALAASPHLTRLTRLELVCRAEGFRGEAVEALAASALAGQLTSLKLDAGAAGPAVVGALAGKGFTRLAELHLDGSRLDEASARRLAGWPGL